MPPPPTEQKEQMLECLLLDKDVPSAARVLETKEGPEDMKKEDMILITELFESLEVAHSELALACSILSRLSQNLKPQQLMTVLRASTRLLIKVKVASALMEPEAPGRKMELPEGQDERVELLMVPVSTAKSWKNKRLNSSTRLLAVMWAFRILNVFGRGTTQRKMQESYSVWAKQLAACITEKKYLGGADRKQKLSGSKEGPLTLKKPATD